MNFFINFKNYFYNYYFLIIFVIKKFESNALLFYFSTFKELIFILKFNIKIIKIDF
jgi:hypothetical protein